MTARTLAAGLAGIDIQRALLIGVETDILFPIEQQLELATALNAQINDVQFRQLASIMGHDSFLVDMDRFRPVMASFL